MACEKIRASKLQKRSSNSLIHLADTHTALLSSGNAADARQIANRAREESSSYYETFDDVIPPKVLADRLSLYIQAHTMYSSVRPFGVYCILAVGNSLYLFEPSGNYSGFKACATGKNSQLAKNELQNLKMLNLSCDEALLEAAKIIYICHKENREKDFDLELSYYDLSNNNHKIVDNEYSSKLLKDAIDAFNASMQYGT